jgi:hypothetical protein
MSFFFFSRINIDQYILTGYGGEYFKISEHGQHVDDKSFLQGYKSALTSKNSEETMVGTKL